MPATAVLRTSATREPERSRPQPARKLELFAPPYRPLQRLRIPLVRRRPPGNARGRPPANPFDAQALGGMRGESESGLKLRFGGEYESELGAEREQGLSGGTARECEP